MVASSPARRSVGKRGDAKLTSLSSWNVRKEAYGSDGLCSNEKENLDQETMGLIEETNRGPSPGSTVYLNEKFGQSLGRSGAGVHGDQSMSGFQQKINEIYQGKPSTSSGTRRIRKQLMGASPAELHQQETTKNLSRTMNLIQAEIFGKPPRFVNQTTGSPKLKQARKEMNTTPKLMPDFDFASPKNNTTGGSKLVKTLKAMKLKNVASNFDRSYPFNKAHSPNQPRFRELNSSCNSRKEFGKAHAAQEHAESYDARMETGEANVNSDVDSRTFQVQHILAEQVPTDVDLNRMPQLDFSNLIEYPGAVHPQYAPASECHNCGQMNEAQVILQGLQPVNFHQYLQQQALPSNRYKQDEGAGGPKSLHHQYPQAQSNLIPTNIPIVTSDCINPPQMYVDSTALATPVDEQPDQQAVANNQQEAQQQRLITLESALQGQRKGVYQMSGGKKKMIDSQHVIQIQQSSGYALQEPNAQYNSMNQQNFTAGVESGQFSSANTAHLAHNTNSQQFAVCQSLLCPMCQQPSQPSITHLQYGQSKYEQPITTTITVIKSEAQQEHEIEQNFHNYQKEQLSHDEELNKRVLEHNPQRFNRMAAYLPKRFCAKPLKIQQMQLEADRPPQFTNQQHYPYGQQDELFNSLNNQAIHPDMARPDLANTLAQYHSLDHKKQVHKLVYNPGQEVPFNPIEGQGNETDIAGSDCQANITISDRNQHDVTVSDGHQGSQMSGGKSVTPRQFMEFEVQNSPMKRAFQTIQDRTVKSQGGTRQTHYYPMKRPNTKTPEITYEPAARTNLKQFKGAKKKVKVESPQGTQFIQDGPQIERQKVVTLQSPRIRSSMNRSITSVNSSLQSKNVRQSNRTPMNQLCPQEIPREFTSSENFQFN